VSGGDHRWFKRSTRQKRPVARDIETSKSYNNNNNNNNNKVQIIKSKQLDHWQYQYLDTVLESLTGTKKNCKNYTGKQGNY